MTTQLPHESPHYGGYPTAPPWAATTPPTSVAGAPPVAVPPPYTQHGQLMVPYPELMGSAGRGNAPSVVPVVLFTFFFGVFGAISAKRRADRAARGGNGRHPYWIAFGATFGVAWILAGAMIMTAAVPAYLSFREDVVTKAVESNIKQSPGANGVGVTAATCAPLGERGSDGMRTYSCSITLSNGKKAIMRVVADSNANARPEN